MAKNTDKLNGYYAYDDKGNKIFIVQDDNTIGYDNGGNGRRKKAKKKFAKLNRIK